MSYKFVVQKAWVLLAFLLCACDKSIEISSATDNVQVLPYQFIMPKLDRQRTVRLYLPPSYYQSDKRYSVVYMHDGQNLFDNKTADSTEWGVDELLNEIAAKQGLELIVVGIDNGGEQRMNELSPWENKRFGVPQGEQYMDFLVEVVKPYIDSNFRTKSDRLHTAIMGSSMGGLISHYGLHAYPEVFSKAGIFSPDYWYSEDVFSFTQSQKMPLDSRLYVMYSDKEGDGMIADTHRMQRQLRQQGHPRNNMEFKRALHNEHHEQLWRTEFSEAIQWLFQQQPSF
ncbi:alpha/beta hydrolase-fold protein [uncultured Paraglaciecola sp.]|uniref:alpha/beta hydrolase n=1 Tax=uncultured Paraglaciecola sp. TaxID=1765024 RepID=UPI00261AEA56|nr:alpha/beta hydrolase-fold protein [uncultured Paraglaciecola sp.]